ncbi:MAG: ASPIC/UnbV domain-containing protein, partial [Planctomycetota bacterium]
VTVDFGTQCQTREVMGGRGAGCQDDMTLLFGLGMNKGRVGISVQWPDGRSSFETGLKSDKYHTLKGKK